jgi:hypothetical protein
MFAIGRQTLARRILLGTVPVTLAVIAILTLSNYWAAKRQILEGVDRETHIIARQAGSELGTFFSQRRHETADLSELPILRDYIKYRDYGLLEEAETYRREIILYFDRFAAKERVYSRIAFLDLQAREWAAVPGDAAAPSPRGFHPQLSASPKRGEVSDSGLGTGQGKAIDYWAGVFGDNGRLRGYIVLTCDLSSLRRLLEGMRVGREGRAVLLDSQDRELLVDRSPLAHPMVAEAPISGTPWRVRLTAKPEEFLAPLRNVQRWSLVAMVLAGLLLTVWIARWSLGLSRPIEEMALGTRHIAGGDLDFRFSPPPIEELKIAAGHREGALLRPRRALLGRPPERRDRGPLHPGSRGRQPLRGHLPEEAHPLGRDRHPE